MLRLTTIASFMLLVCGNSPLLAQSVSIRALTFEGNQAVDSARLKGLLRMSRDGGWYNPDVLKMELLGVERYYQEEGFLRAKIGAPAVEFQTIPGKGQAAVIRVPVSEGPRYVLGELDIKNVQVFKTATLLQMLPVRPGQPYSRKKIEDWRQKIEEGYHTMGYIRFESSLREEIHDLRRVVDCVVELKEGNAYRVGKITLSGDDSLSATDFKKKLFLAEGSMYNPELLSLTVTFLNSTRFYRPISMSDVEIRIDDEKSTVDISFRIISLRKPSSS